jgi:hypothetical protein
MRSLLVCATLCVFYPHQTSHDLIPDDLSQTTQAIPVEHVSLRADDFLARFIFESPWLPQSGFSERIDAPDMFAHDEVAAEPVTVASDSLEAVEAEPVRTFSKKELCSTVATVAVANNLPIPFFANLIQQESAFKPHAVSPAGAQGIAQFMPRVAEEHGLEDPFDPVPALHASGKFLSRLRAQFGDNLGLAAAAYNAGARRVQDWMAKRGKLPAETRQYVRNITGRPAELWARGRVKNAEAKLPLYARCAEAKAALAEASAREAEIARSKPAVVARAAAKTGKRAAAATKVARASKPAVKAKAAAVARAAAKSREASAVAAKASSAKSASALKQRATAPKKLRVASR